jgi:two-component sensor histidine kinase
MSTATSLLERPQGLPRKLLRHLLWAMAANAAIAAVLTAFGQQTLSFNMVYSQCIGLLIWLLIDGGRHLIEPQGRLSMGQAVVVTALGGLTGYLGGSALGDAFHGLPILGGWHRAPVAMSGFLLMSLFVASVLVYVFMSREILAHERAEREQAQRQAVDAQLKLLQSQLDPHMLFNTLANLRVLISSDAPRAVQMLDQLNDFLRASLSASRQSEHTLQAEFDRLQDYLALMHIRMGQRLDFLLHLPHELAQKNVPTLILQSLVENAVLHGLEPKVEGGRVEITALADTQAQQLVLQVKDDGLGLRDAPLREGFGITQVRERLRSRYGAQATIEFIAAGARLIRPEGQIDHKNSPSGCHVELRIPL